MSRHRKPQEETNEPMRQQLAAMRRAADEQMERLEAVALDLLAEIRMARRCLTRRTGKLRLEKRGGDGRGCG
jgi:hypothetical protein